MLPAQAGVIPRYIKRFWIWPDAPRAGGGDPSIFRHISYTFCMLPAQAGVIL